MEPHGALLCPSIFMHEPSVLISNHRACLAYALYFHGQYDRVQSVKLPAGSRMRSFCPAEGIWWISSRLLRSFEVLARSKSAAPRVVNCGLKIVYWSKKLSQA